MFHLFPLQMSLLNGTFTGVSQFQLLLARGQLQQYLCDTYIK